MTYFCDLARKTLPHTLQVREYRLQSASLTSSAAATGREGKLIAVSIVSMLRILRKLCLVTSVCTLKAEVAEADERYVKLYDDLSNGIISESKFKLLTGKIEERQKVALSEIERLEEQLKTSEADSEAVELFADQFADATRIKELSYELLNRLVDKIEVSEIERADGETVQKV